ncbi:MAG: branched-chain amino acid ABC transporter permease [alpha proteobacterium HIMB59]|nr:MAG: branched-chain amino acid ABC transporter permease [alpha proteobacterium HIMB59]
MGFLLLIVGILQSWGVAFSILNLCLISAVMSMGVNIQWGFAGLINFGVMGFLAIGGLATILVSVPPVIESWNVGGLGIIFSLLFLIFIIFLCLFINKRFSNAKYKYQIIFLIVVLTIPAVKLISGPSIKLIESINPAAQGYLGGLGLPIILSWFVGGIMSAAIAYVIGKICLGLRSDYLAISTLLISGIIVSVIKHEEWLSRGVKNVIGLKRPAPYEVNLQNSEWFIKMIETIRFWGPTTKDIIISSSGIFVKLCFTVIFSITLLILLYLSERAVNSPWGRMMRAIRDNETAAKAMGKNIVKQQLNIFMIGSAIIGFAGAMLVTYDGLFTPSSYQPLRYTFLIWVMVLLGGSGNNYGSILGGFVVWFIWIESAPIALFIINFCTFFLEYNNPIKLHLIESVPYFRYLMMGVGLLLVMRYKPEGLLPEKKISF